MSVGTEGVTPCVNAAGPPGRFHHETTLLTAFSRKPAWWGNSIPEKESGRFNWFLTHSNETKTCPFRKRGGAFYVTSSHLVSSFHEVYMNKSRAEMTIKILWFQLLTSEYFLVIWISLGCWWKTRLLRTSSQTFGKKSTFFWYIIFWPNDKWVKEVFFSGPAAVKRTSPLWKAAAQTPSEVGAGAWLHWLNKAHKYFMVDT